MHWLYRTCHRKLPPFFLPTIMCSENWGKNHILKKVWQGGITIIIIGLIPIGKINFQEKLVKIRQKFPKNSVFSPEAPIGTTGEYFFQILLNFDQNINQNHHLFFKKYQVFFFVPRLPVSKNHLKWKIFRSKKFESKNRSEKFLPKVPRHKKSRSWILQHNQVSTSLSTPGKFSNYATKIRVHYYFCC